MRRIGILTLTFFNYGTKLQSYVLAKIVKKLVGSDVDVDVINIESQWNKYETFDKWRFVNDNFRLYISKYGIYGCLLFINLMKWVIKDRKISKHDYSQQKIQRRNSFKTLDSNIPYSQKRYTYSDARSCKLSEYDAIIVGSDQVWNDVKVENQDIYMLESVNVKHKLTYAASFGMTEFTDKNFDDYKRRISNFPTLLMRETAGIKMCEKLGRNDARLVLDPTLLIDGNEWNEVVDEKRYVDGDYVLVYSLNHSLKIFNQAYKFAVNNNCKMVVLKRSFCPPDVSKYKGAVELYEVSPEGFLSLIKNAKCVITNSYHALIFSVILHSDYYLYLDKVDQENSRMLSLSEMLNVEDRIIWEDKSLPKTMSSVDFSHTDEILSIKRQESIDLLKRELSDAGFVAYPEKS